MCSMPVFRFSLMDFGSISRKANSCSEGMFVKALSLACSASPFLSFHPLTNVRNVPSNFTGSTFTVFNR